MKTTKYIALCLLISTCTGLPCAALDSRITIWGENDWRDIVRLENIDKKPGKWGYRDLLLKDAEYRIDDSTDCLIHFNTTTMEDSTGNYIVNPKNPLVTPKESMFGASSAVFQSTDNTITLSSAKKSPLFTQGVVWDDFSIEFWLAPAHLSDNEIVFSWDGVMKQNGNSIPQHARCSINKRRLSWDFGSFFVSQEGATSIALVGIRELVPRAWHHHMIRFDSGTGLLEYLVDGIPEAVTHATETGKESSLVYRPFAGNVLPFSLAIGSRYTGFMDELRISRAFVDKPMLKKYGNSSGSAYSRVFDLKGSGSLSKRTEVTQSTPSSSFVSYFIRASDSAFSDENAFDIPWIEFDPKADFDPPVKGRFVQLSIRMFPDGTKSVSPAVSRIELVSEERLPPPAPIGLVARPANGSVSLAWKRVNYEGIKDYRIYYGEEPGRYDGAASTAGRSPIDVGSATEFRVNGLSNGTLYYFAVVAYDSEEFPNVSNFSGEASARPLGLYK